MWEKLELLNKIEETNIMTTMLVKGKDMLPCCHKLQKTQLKCVYKCFCFGMLPCCPYVPIIKYYANIGCWPIIGGVGCNPVARQVPSPNPFGMTSRLSASPSPRISWICVASWHVVCFNAGSWMNHLEESGLISLLVTSAISTSLGLGITYAANIN